MADGLLWYSTPRATVGLIVVGGAVVDGPPYARRWALGRDARELWRRAKTEPNTRVAWIPDDEGGEQV